MLLDENHRNYFVPLNRFNIVSSTLSKLTAEHLPWLSCLKKNWLSYIRRCWTIRFIYCFVETACRKTLAIPKLSSWCQSFSTYFSVQTSSNLNNGFGFGFDWDRWWPIWQKDQNNGNKFTECVFPHKNTNKNSWKTYFTAPLLRLILLLCWIESTVLQSFREFREFWWGAMVLLLWLSHVPNAPYQALSTTYFLSSTIYLPNDTTIPNVLAQFADPSISRLQQWTIKCFEHLSN